MWIVNGVTMNVSGLEKESRTPYRLSTVLSNRKLFFILAMSRNSESHESELS